MNSHLTSPPMFLTTQALELHLQGSMLDHPTIDRPLNLDRRQLLKQQRAAICVWENEGGSTGSKRNYRFLC
jgi:hypothetical protein